MLLPGDGIGPEIAQAVRTVFEVAQIPIEWHEEAAGLSVVAEYPSGISASTIERIAQYGCALKGPTTTPSGVGHRSINVFIRKHLGLFANVRPVKALPGVRAKSPSVDLTIIRENLEDTYSGIEYMMTPTVAHGIKLSTQLGAYRASEYAFQYAKREGRGRVTCGHKANIHKQTDGLFLDTFWKVAAQFPEIDADDILVDNLCMQLVTNSDRFDVLVMPNLYGDIVSDLCAGLIGGLGVAPAGNIGLQASVFEAVHGSAPDIAGKNLANPTALLGASLMLLRHLGLFASATRVERALHAALLKGRCTRDLGGTLSTQEFAQAICNELRTSPDDEESQDPKARLSLAPRLPVSEGSLDFTGIDIFFRSADVPDSCPQMVGALELHALSNRGIDIHESSHAGEMSDLFCAHYQTSSGLVADEDIAELIGIFQRRGIEWSAIHKVV